MREKAGGQGWAIHGLENSVEKLGYSVERV